MQNNTAIAHLHTAYQPNHDTIQGGRIDDTRLSNEKTLLTSNTDINQRQITHQNTLPEIVVTSYLTPEEFISCLNRGEPFPNPVVITADVQLKSLFYTENIRKFPSQLKVLGNLEISNCRNITLDIDSLEVDSLSIIRCPKITKLPEKTAIKHKLLLNQCPIDSLPEGLTVDDLEIRTCDNLHSIANVKVKDNLTIDSNNLKTIPEEINLTGLLSIGGYNAHITQLPEKLNVNAINLHSCLIATIPETAKIKTAITFFGYFEAHPDIYLPKGLVVERLEMIFCKKNIHIEGMHITQGYKITNCGQPGNEINAQKNSSCYLTIVDSVLNDKQCQPISIHLKD